MIKDYKEVILDRESEVPKSRKRITLSKKITNIFSTPQIPVRYYYHSILYKGELYSFDGMNHCPCCNGVAHRFDKKTYWICRECNQKVLYSEKFEFGTEKFWEERDRVILESLAKYYEIENKDLAEGQNMACRFASRTDEYHGWKCAETDGACMFFFPDEKKCFEEYGEGPLAFEEQEDEAEPCMKYAFMQLKDDFFALIDAEEYTFFDELLERGKSKETDIAIDEDSIDNTAYKLVYGGVLINTHLMDVETAIKTIDKMLNYAFLYIEKEKATVCTYCAIEMFPTISKAENWIPFVALMKLPVSLQNQSCSITLTPAISEKEHEKCLWEYMVNRPFLLACRYEAVIEELTEENYKDYVDLDYMIEAYNKADLVEI